MPTGPRREGKKEWERRRRNMKASRGLHFVVCLHNLVIVVMADYFPPSPPSFSLIPPFSPLSLSSLPTICSWLLFSVFCFFPPLFGESLHAMKCLFLMMLFTSRGRSLFAALGIEPSQIQMGKREITTTNNTGGIENRERPEPNLHDRIPDPHFSIGAFPIWKAIRSTVREPSSAAIDHCFYIGRKIRQCLIHHRYPQCVCDAICMDCR